MNTTLGIRAFTGALAALCGVLFLTGCFQIEQAIHVKADGSGTVTTSMKMSKETIEQMRGVAKLNGAEPKEGEGPLGGMQFDEQASKQAKEMGEGVKLEKVEAFKDEKFEGKRAIYSFADVRELRLDMNLSDMNPQHAGGVSPDEKDQLTFEFTKGAPAALVIKARHRKSTPRTTPEAEDANEAAGLAMAQQFLKDTRLTIVVSVEGDIVETDAAYRDGSRVILADIPFGDLLKDPSRLKGLKNAETWDEAVKLFKGVPSIKLEPKGKISVKFQ